MRKDFISFHCLSGLWLAVTLSYIAGANAAESPTPVLSQKADIRIVPCDAHLQSRKRGVGANKLSAADFRALAPGVSWYYNWHFEPGDVGTPPADVPIEFIPMVWGKQAESLAGLEKYLAAGHKPRQVLGINEPNLSEQAFMTPQEAAELYGKIKTVTDKYKIPLAGPQMSIGSPPNMSIKAIDPIENKELTYTYMIPYLKAFFHYADKAGTDVAGVGIHPYMNAGGLSGLTTLTYQEFKRPVWVTEFNLSDDAASMEDTRIYLVQAVDFMERHPYVQGYAFFKERFAGHPNVSLLANEPGKLSPLGEAYVNMPIHDPLVYYSIPGRLQAEKYVTLDKMEIWPTKDVDGFAHLTFNAPSAYADYNIHVAQAGKYKVRLRMIGQPGNLSLLEGDTVLSTFKATPNEGNWTTIETTIDLPDGAQTLRIRAENAGLGINWIELVKD